MVQENFGPRKIQGPENFGSPGQKIFILKIKVPTIFSPENFGSQMMLCVTKKFGVLKKFEVLKKSWTQKILGHGKILVSKNVESQKKVLVPIRFGPWKM